MPATPPESMNRKPLWLAKIINSIRDFAVQSRITSIMVVPAEANRPSAEITETPSGTLIKLRTAGGGVKEVITGAVSGIPATLNVLTDGTGWHEIEEEE